ncbi:MAG: heparinase II/III family protein [Hyphomicrobiales bacterium]|nr:heparinase II/III family protein [Hyphomicrobiales bacterium]
MVRRRACLLARLEGSPGLASRASVAERTRLSAFLVRGLARRLLGRLTGFLAARMPFIPGAADRLLIAPQDLRTADATRASEIYAGRFTFGGKVVVCDARSPFAVKAPSEDWSIALHGFGWLRHLRAAESGIARANARALVDEWISLRGSGDAAARRSEVTARRIISWISQAPLVLDDSDVRFYRRFLRSLTRQVRHLRHTAAETRDGVPRLLSMLALMYAALCMANQARHIKLAIKRLSDELERQILPDGGHISRNPGALIELLIDLLPLRQVFTARNVAPPPALLHAIDRMMPMLRFFRHGDGNFALFNGMGPTRSDLLGTVLAYDDARGTPVSNAAHSGYQRLEATGTVVIMDTGKPPPLAASQEAHAGCLSFELSAKYNRIIVNCGLPTTGRDSWRQVARATSAHSTATLNDVSSCRFIESGAIRRLLQGAPIIGGPRHVDVAREVSDSGAQVLRTAHDGYVGAFGIVHHRALLLSADGNRLDGEELFQAANGEIPASHDHFALRFHLHPSVKASRLQDSHGAMLVLPNKEVWTFNAYEDRIELEESVYLAGNDGPRRTVQIVIYGQARKVPRVQWMISMIAASPLPQRRSRGEEPKLPL